MKGKEKRLFSETIIHPYLPASPILAAEIKKLRQCKRLKQ
jgi:hypothetical protein